MNAHRLCLINGPADETSLEGRAGSQMGLRMCGPPYICLVPHPLRCFSRISCPSFLALFLPVLASMRYFLIPLEVRTAHLLICGSRKSTVSQSVGRSNDTKNTVMLAFSSSSSFFYGWATYCLMKDHDIRRTRS